MEAYRPIAAFYDGEHDQFTDDIEWYLHLAQVAGTRVLELGCGSGRLLGPLAAAGNRVVGLDSSSAMLERAQLRLQAAIARGNVTLLLGDMQDVSRDVSGTFDLVIVPLNGLLHVDDSPAQRRVLEGARSVLRPGGLLALDVLHPIPDMLTTFDGRVVHEASWQDGDTAVVKFSSRTVDWTNQLIASEIWYDQTLGNGTVTRHQTAFGMRWLTPAELDLLLEIAGFEHTNLAGAYDGSSLTDMSDRILAVARKPDGN